MAGAGYKLFNTGDVLLASEVNTYLQQQVTMVFANATARTSALSGVLAEGMMSYLQDTNTVEVYDGSNWVSVGNTGDITGITTGANSGLTGGVTSGTADLKVNFASKGQLAVGTGSGTTGFLNVGTNGHTLVADSAETTGLKWQAASSGALTKITDGSFTSASTVTVDNVFSSTYKRYAVYLRYIFVTNQGDLQWQFRYSSSTETGSTYFGSGFRQNRTNTKADYGFANATYATVDNGGATNSDSILWMYLDKVGNSSENPHAFQQGLSANSQAVMQSTIYNSQARTYTGFILTPSTGTLTGQYAVYGVQN